MTKFGKTIVVLATALLLAVVGWRWGRERFKNPPASMLPRPEVELTIIPGWNVRQVAEYLVLKGFATSTKDIFALTGEPAKETTPQLSMPISSDVRLAWDTKPANLSWEGYIAPETIRVFAEASLEEVVRKFINQSNVKARELVPNLTVPSNKNWHEIVTMASIIEKEVKHDADRARVADILWRRLNKGWALQVDSSVHYAVDKTGTVFTTGKERAVESPWNTYKYPGLPPGPISNPGPASLKAALFPEPNDYWYFLSGRDGKIYYAKILEEHNKNKKYL